MKINHNTMKATETTCTNCGSMNAKAHEEGRKDLAREILGYDYYDCTYEEMFEIIIEQLKLVIQ